LGNELTSLVDFHFLLSLAISVVFATTLSVLTGSQRSRYALWIGLAGTVLYYYRAFIGFVLVIGIAYIVLRWLSRQTAPEKRWRRACACLFALIALFTLGRTFHWYEMSFTGERLTFYSLDMWLALRLVTLFWEVGSGTVPLPIFSHYLVWACLPLTLGGPLIRFSKFAVGVPPDAPVWKSSAFLEQSCDRAVYKSTWLFLDGFGLLPAHGIDGLPLGRTRARKLQFSNWPGEHFIVLDELEYDSDVCFS
jgi:hypothetical protein